MINISWKSSVPFGNIFLKLFLKKGRLLGFISMSWFWFFFAGPPHHNHRDHYDHHNHNHHQKQHHRGHPHPGARISLIFGTCLFLWQKQPWVTWPRCYWKMNKNFSGLQVQTLVNFSSGRGWLQQKKRVLRWVVKWCLPPQRCFEGYVHKWCWEVG